MKLFIRTAGMTLFSLLILLLPVIVYSQTAPPTGSPPIAAPLIREGTFAVKLVFNLGLSATDDEAEAEERLADVGILPRNGWIADYPVTPDIAGELQQTMNDAAVSEKISLSKEESLVRFNKTLSEAGLSYASEGNREAGPSGSENYPNPSVINNYYYDQGPPVVTGYTPPPDFYYMYAWVPFPFWWSGFWFPGFFVLHDFHRTIIVDRRAFVVSNHFRDVRVNRVFRIDPTLRFQGRTFGGIGGSRVRGLVPTGVPRSERRIFNRPMNLPDRGTVPPARGGRILRAPSRGATVAPPSPRGAERGRLSAPHGSGGSSGRGQRR